VPHVPGRDALDVPEPDRHRRLRRCERLDLALLVGAEYERLVGRVQVEADHLPHLVDEQRVRR
jgi:hypothetical protein